MKITEDYYKSQKNTIEGRYLQMAEEFTQQMLDCMDWKSTDTDVDAQIVIALWLKYNEPRCKNIK